MRLYKKEGDIIQLISFPDEQVEKGDYLLIEDQKVKKGLIVQVIDIQFANIPGMLEDILRDVMTEESIHGEDYDPFDVSSQITVLKDTRLIICKIRGMTDNGRISSSVSHLPSRISSKIIRFPIETVIEPQDKSRPIRFGTTKSGTELTLDAKVLDGRLNIITGKKGTGKSHLSKLLVLSLVDNKAPCVVLDVNGEYVNLSKNKSSSAETKRRIKVLTPGMNMKLTLAQVGLGTMLSVLLFALDLPGNSARVFSGIWRQLQDRNELTLISLGAAIHSWNCHESVRDAIVSRYNTIVESGMFTDDPGGALDFEKVARELSGGEALIVNMKNQYSTMRRMTVEILLSKLTDLLMSWKMKAVFFFAEEAHLYLRETYWEDIVTRMRHIGIFTTFITNQPDTIKDSIYRQADNIFLFNFMNENDLETVSKAAKIDGESVKLIAKDLPVHHCLIIGEAVRNFPLVVNIHPLNVETMGETRFFFKD
jgi:DNA helicase HerA-like ATPase